MAPTTRIPLTDWLPVDSRKGLQQRGWMVLGVALLLAGLQWLVDPVAHPLDVSLVYSLGISLCSWCCTDVSRVLLHRWVGSTGPSYWVLNTRMVVLMLGGALLGYSLGTLLGDAYSGRSTWALLVYAPERFAVFLLWSLVISAGFLAFFYQRERGRELAWQAREAQLRLLESQLEPHMLFNTLANLRVLIATNPNQALVMLDHLNNYLRATLQASRSALGTHTLAMEFDRLRDYLAIMAVRMGPRLRVRLDLPPHLANHPLPALLLQPLVENAIQHGLEPSVQGGEVRVSASNEPGALVLTITDTGAGSATEPQTQRPSRAGGGGFGLQQVRERLATAYGTTSRLQWHSQTGEGTVVTLHLPLQTTTPPT